MRYLCVFDLALPGRQNEVIILALALYLIWLKLVVLSGSVFKIFLFRTFLTFTIAILPLNAEVDASPSGG